MFKYIIIDDEPLAHEIIEEFCSMLPHLQLEQNCYNAIEAIKFLNENTVDFMFLDINMPKLKGLDFLKTLTNPPKTIITTAYKEHAIEGFELNVVDYILKPFSFDRLVKAINKISKSQESKTTIKEVNNTNAPSNRLFVKGDKKHHQIDLKNLLFIEAYGNYTKLFLNDEMIISHEKISHYETILDSSLFLRVHKSFIVTVDKIKFIEGNRIIIDNHKVPIGQTYKSTVSKLYN
ncbi:MULTISPECIES: LytR/AlgR family response regulator transcription factor [unclassified Tenacibaculum]|uniref:LytR/AlgR family response regulator transcription factor n=1 Tax=unclassified Tenacibaculum TaxID=2635139 RepID=UPI001F282B61|nr:MULTISPECIES: response regulator transcription factor [unclassified Tenacibaculum]MCF2875113.1 response regulator transcription factor [Tenacibaculum sp. Cn5-1]MCF2935189.1 response regulator transcription factor [Tenacibaculum sp. Cn5-34]MCG7511369.1 response regulator transcription factor [Tenacibaculum sp. Cn5-46]